ncbi:uncharacterized protein LOC127874030 [Dreissena polymorpha]|uniref:Uncharacterized protein n=1 Tax=Dreissena polymorpha TaxID=45954 RepID=A0A9D4QX18_DREPO|nr:uncharacterized protein LOC127874030 [Dreissena polymorpha]KAH3846826.1 hypothetical protein DPMN_089133 [Dreissena polymorpha]
MKRRTKRSQLISKNNFPIFCYTSDRVTYLIEEINFVQKKQNQPISFGDIRIDEVCFSTDFFGKCLELFSDSANKTQSSVNQIHVIQPHICIVHGHDSILSLYKEKLVPECIVVIGNSKVLLDEKETGMAMVVHSSLENVKQDIDLLLERYVFRFLREFVDQKECSLSYHRLLTNDCVSRDKPVWKGENDRTLTDLISYKRQRDFADPGTLRSGKRFRSSDSVSDSAKDEEIHILFQDAMALFKRSSVPKNEWPAMKCINTRVLKPEVARDLFAIDSSIDGCGYQHHVLQIYLKRHANTALDKTLTTMLHRHSIYNYRFHYNVSAIQPLAGIHVGTKLQRSDCFATLGGFAKKGTRLHVLTSRHFIRKTRTNYIYHKIDGVHAEGFATVERSKLRGELDIAAGLVLPGCEISETKFKDSRGIATQSSLFDFQGQSEEQTTDMLRGEYIFSWTAECTERPKVGKISIPLYIRPDFEYKYLLIKNRANNGNNPFGRAGDSGAIICRDERGTHAVNVISMFIGKRQSDGNEEYITLPLQQGIQQLSGELGGDFQIC